MTRISTRIRVRTLFLLVAIGSVARAAAEPAVPDPDIQKLLMSVKVGPSGDALTALADASKKNPSRMAVNLAYFSSQVRSPADAAIYLEVKHRLRIDWKMFPSALAAQLSTNDDAFRKTLKNLLRGDEQAWRTVVRAAHRRSVFPGHHFVAFMFHENPSAAVVTMASSYMDRDVPELRRVMLAVRVVEEAIWRKTWNYRAEYKAHIPSAKRQLRSLADHKEWYVRLYVATLISRHTELAEDDIVTKLKSDQHELIRRVLKEKTRGPGRTGNR